MTDSKRYVRLVSLPEIGAAGMERIRNGKVMVVGCGALGSMCAMQLCASGVGTVGIADFDTIDISNLQRQLFFGEDCLGKSKADILAQRMHTLNSDVKVVALRQLVNEEKAKRIFPVYDFVVEGSDNPATKYLVARICESLQIPYCIGGVREFSAQVMSWSPGHITYSDIFGPEPAADDADASLLPCSAAGVFGPTAATTASIQTSEALKWLTQSGDMLLDRCFVADLLTNSFKVLSL